MNGRLATIAGISLIGIFVLTIFGVVALAQGSSTLGLVDFIVAFLLLCNLHDAKSRGEYSGNILFGMTLISYFFVYLYLSGGLNQTHGPVQLFPLIYCQDTFLSQALP